MREKGGRQGEEGGTRAGQGIGLKLVRHINSSGGQFTYYLNPFAVNKRSER